MKVKELIELLKEFNQEEEVHISVRSGEAFGIDRIERDGYLESIVIKHRGGIE